MKRLKNYIGTYWIACKNGEAYKNGIRAAKIMKFSKCKRHINYYRARTWEYSGVLFFDKEAAVHYHQYENCVDKGGYIEVKFNDSCSRKLPMLPAYRHSSKKEVTEILCFLQL